MVDLMGFEPTTSRMRTERSAAWRTFSRRNYSKTKSKKAYKNMTTAKNGVYSWAEEALPSCKRRPEVLLYPKGDPEYKNTQLTVVNDAGYILAMNTMALKHECVYNMTFIASKSRRELDELQKIYREYRAQFEALKQ